MQINVLHPQDKRAILIGYETNCCFRPNGNADDLGDNENSLLQYCATTQYGGILRCDGEKEVYMGTPFLVNGNCMMFHSYESKETFEDSTECNKLLENAAIQAIEKSDGTINAVFMTILHIGKSKLQSRDKVVIPDFFESYIEEEYNVYKDMYTNLNYKNCVLAVKYKDKIISGKALKKWYKKECNEDFEEFIEKLGLHMGKRDFEYDFGRKECLEEIEIVYPKLVSAFSREKSKLEEKREILSLILEKNKLEGEEIKSDRTKKEIQLICSKLEENPDKEYIEIMSKKSISEIREIIQENRNEQLYLYSGEDLDLIASVYNIDFEAELRKRAEESVKDLKIKNKKKSNTGRVISTLIAKINESKSEKINAIENIRQKIAKNTITDEELEILKSEGIEIDEYLSAFKDDEKEDVQNDNLTKSKIEQKVKKGLKDPMQKEAVIEEFLFSEVTEEEIKKRAKLDFKVHLRNEIYQKITSKKQENIQEEIDNEIQIVNIRNLTENYLNNTLTNEQKDAIGEIKKEYDINFDEIYINISQNEEKLKKEIRQDKMAKLKALITIGLEREKKIQTIKAPIDEFREDKQFITKFIYGNSWYIALDEKGQILETKINEKIDENGFEMPTYKKELEKINKSIEQSDWVKEDREC